MQRCLLKNKLLGILAQEIMTLSTPYMQVIDRLRGSLLCSFNGAQFNDTLRAFLPFRYHFLITIMFLACKSSIYNIRIRLIRRRHPEFAKGLVADVSPPIARLTVVNGPHAPL